MHDDATLTEANVVTSIETTTLLSSVFQYEWLSLFLRFKDLIWRIVSIDFLYGLLSELFAVLDMLLLQFHFVTIKQLVLQCVSHFLISLFFPFRKSVLCRHRLQSTDPVTTFKLLC